MTARPSRSAAGCAICAPAKISASSTCPTARIFSQVQVVYGAELANFHEISKLNIGAAVIVTGTLVVTPDAKQPFEIQASEVTVEGPSTPDYPHSAQAPLAWSICAPSRICVPRTNTFQAVFRVRSLIAYAIHKFFQERGFVYVHTPLITGSDCEGAGEMFQVTTLDLEQPAHDRGRQGRLHQGLLRQADQPDRLRPAQRRDLRAWPSATSIPSARPSAPKTPTPPATPPSSG